MTWLEYFINIAEQVKLKSKDNNRQIGVVIVGSDNEIRSTGYNSFPKGINDIRSERQEKPEKFFWFAHAERNSIYNAARVGIATEGCIMYTANCGVPCTDCAIAIINSGIKEVWVNYNEQNNNNPMWMEHSIRSIQMFEEAGVRLRYWRYNENNKPIVINGKD